MTDEEWNEFLTSLDEPTDFEEVEAEELSGGPLYAIKRRIRRQKVDGYYRLWGNWSKSRGGACVNATKSYVREHFIDSSEWVGRCKPKEDETSVLKITVE